MGFLHAACLALAASQVHSQRIIGSGASRYNTGGAGRQGADMRRALGSILVALVICAGAARADEAAPADTAARLAARALADNSAFAVVQSLTTEVGQRLAGTEATARAVKWAKAHLTAMGLGDVHTEPFALDAWVRGDETACGRLAHSLSARDHRARRIGRDRRQADRGRDQALSHLCRAARGAARLARRQDRGGDAAHGARGRWRRLWRRQSDPAPGSVRGGQARRAGLSAPLARHRRSSPAAHRRAQLRRRRAAHSRGGALQSRRRSARALGRARARARAPSPDAHRARECAILERRRRSEGARAAGRDRADRRASRFLGPRHRRDRRRRRRSPSSLRSAGSSPRLPQHPRRTVASCCSAPRRWTISGPAYAKAHEAEAAHIALAAEADFGSRPVYAVQLPAALGHGPLRPHALRCAGAARRLHRSPSGARQRRRCPRAATLWACRSRRCARTGSIYFDTHHTADDTLDKIDPGELAHAVSVWAAFVYLAAELDVDFRAAPRPRRNSDPNPCARSRHRAGRAHRRARPACALRPRRSPRARDRA